MRFDIIIFFYPLVHGKSALFWGPVYCIYQLDNKAYLAGVTDLWHPSVQLPSL